ncbi:hypothetical protein [Mesobacillus jeotgali]|uniref:hypothetical protein n=1 Tax=Mesobacillus jeotgali TaxID=129985 RepID=UPI0009A716BF|nr:hypothetical protein [Mesobacillus jeotgali]
MKDYSIENLIVDDEAYDQEHVTAEITFEEKMYMLTFQKSDLELMNAWLLKDGSSIPANLSESVIQEIKEDISKKIQ